MASPIWDGVVTYLTWVTTSTNSFNVPAGSGAITFILPNFTTDTSTQLEGLDPINKTSWYPVEAYDPAGGVADEVLLLESTYTVVPVSAIGCGTFRLTNANTQAGLQATVIIDRI